MNRNKQIADSGFTLVELLVVIGIIAVLLGLLMPALSGARLQGQRIKCLSNMKNIGYAMQMYSNDNHGLLVPLGPLQDGSQGPICVTLTGAADTTVVGDGPGNSSPYCYMTLGTEVYPWYRWPALLLKDVYAPIPLLPAQPPYLVHEPTPGDPSGVLAAPWSAKMMVCPSDPNPGAAHSYLINEHLVQDQLKVLKYSSKPPSGKTDGEVVVLGEKRSAKDDYYMEQGDFPTDTSIPSTTHVELYRHGAKLGSNYLYKDMHAENKPPRALSDEVDPWDIAPVASTSTN